MKSQLFSDKGIEKNFGFRPIYKLNNAMGIDNVTTSNPLSGTQNVTHTDGKTKVSETKSTAISDWETKKATFLNDFQTLQKKYNVQEGHIWSANQAGNTSTAAKIKQFFTNIKLWFSNPSVKLDESRREMVASVLNDMGDGNDRSEDIQNIRDGMNAVRDQYKRRLNAPESKLGKVLDRARKDTIVLEILNCGKPVEELSETDAFDILQTMKNFTELPKVRLPRSFEGCVTYYAKEALKTLGDDVGNRKTEELAKFETFLRDFQMKASEGLQDTLGDCLKACQELKTFHELKTASEEIIKTAETQNKALSNALKQYGKKPNTPINEEISAFSDTVREFFEKEEAVARFAKSSYVSETAKNVLKELQRAENMLFENIDDIIDIADKKTQDANAKVLSNLLKMYDNGEISSDELNKKKNAKELPEEIRELNTVKSERLEPLSKLKEIKEDLTYIRQAIKSGKICYAEGMSEEDKAFVKKTLSSLVSRQSDTLEALDDPKYTFMKQSLRAVRDELQTLENEITGIEKLEKRKEVIKERQAQLVKLEENVKELKQLENDKDNKKLDNFDPLLSMTNAYTAPRIKAERDQKNLQNEIKESKTQLKTDFETYKQFMETFGSAFRADHNLAYKASIIPESKQELYFKDPSNEPK